MNCDVDFFVDSFNLQEKKVCSNGQIHSEEKTVLKGKRKKMSNGHNQVRVGTTHLRDVLVGVLSISEES